VIWHAGAGGVAVRRLILGSLVFGGCTAVNPAWDDGADTRGGSAATSDATGADPTSTTPAPTSGDGSGGATNDTTGAVVSPTSGGDTTGDTTIDTTGDTTDASTGGDSTTEAPLKCMAAELVPLDVPLADTGVVPTAMGSPCAWGGGPDCGRVNFGTTEFYRLVNDVAGTNAALLRFQVDSLTAAAATVGVDPADVVGIRVELVVWEQLAGPTAPYVLAIHGLAADNADFGEGDKNAGLADEGDASDQCKTILGGSCVTWANGGRALDDSEPLGSLYVTPEEVVEHDQDGNAGEYHAQLLSDSLPAAALLFKDRVPALAVTIETPRPLGEQVVGIKLKESMPWKDPTLYLEVCTDWTP